MRNNVCNSYGEWNEEGWNKDSTKIGELEWTHGFILSELLISFSPTELAKLRICI